jgi:hypothetical protein
MRILLIVAVFWIVCGVLAWGMYQGYRKDADWGWLPDGSGLGWFCLLLGPLGLFAVVSSGDWKWHWSWKPATMQERWEKWQRRGFGSSIEDRAEFERFQSKY